MTIFNISYQGKAIKFNIDKKPTLRELHQIISTQFQIDPFEESDLEVIFDNLHGKYFPLKKDHDVGYLYQLGLGYSRFSNFEFRAWLKNSPLSSSDTDSNSTLIPSGKVAPKRKIAICYS